MNRVLERLAQEVALSESANERLRLQFGHACASRASHFIEDPAVAVSLDALRQYLSGSLSRSELDVAAERAARLATQHQGSKSIDGAGHAAVSATYAVANALAGKAVQAAEYAAYAVVYGEGGYGAVSDPESFGPEFEWQVSCLLSLASQPGRGSGEA